MEHEIAKARSLQDNGRRTIQILESIDAKRPENFAEKERQLALAHKLQRLLDSVTVEFEHKGHRDANSKT